MNKTCIIFFSKENIFKLVIRGHCFIKITNHLSEKMYKLYRKRKHTIQDDKNEKL